MVESLSSTRLLLLAFVITGSVCGTVDAAAGGVLQAEEPQSAAEFFPETCILYAELPQLGKDVETILAHPLTERVMQHEAWAKVEESEGWQKFVAGRTFVELQMGAPWKGILSVLTERGIYVGFDGPTQGFVMAVRAGNPEAMELYRTKMMALIRMGGDAKLTEDTYRDISVYRIDELRAAVSGSWLIITNKTELGQKVLDRFVAVHERDKGDLRTLRDLDEFATAMSNRSADLSAWSWLNLEQLRADERVAASLSGKAENPGAELIAGGIQSLLRETPYVTAELKMPEAGPELTLLAPWKSEWIPEERQWYFGPESAGAAPELPETNSTLLSVSAWRDVSEMWLRAGDLFSEQMNDQLAAADSTLTTLFAGKDFATDILASFEPQMGLIVARQDFTDVRPAPAIRLPAFAFVLQLKEPEKMTRELRRTFQSMVGFFNVVGAMEGQPQLELDIEKLEQGELLTSTYLAEEDVAQSETADLIFNFSPSMAFAGRRCVISSSRNLAHELITAEAAPEVVGGAEGKAEVVNSHVNLNGAVLHAVLDDNRNQLISQNMLEQGHSRESAEAQIGLLLEVVSCFRDASLSLSHNDSQIQLRTVVRVRQEP